MLRATKLFGHELKVNPCYFVHDKGEGFWFMGIGQRSVGEAKFLGKITQEIDNQELSNSWLIVEILRDNREVLLTEYIQKQTEQNPNFNEKKLSPRELTIALEQYVRNVLSEDFLHPVLGKYYQRITEQVSNNNQNQRLQLEIIECAFRFRVVTKPELLVKTDDEERADLPIEVLLSGSAVGYTGKIELDDLTESLAMKIYEFMVKDFQSAYKTAKEIEASKPKTEATVVKSPVALIDEDETEEKKQPASELEK